MKWDDGLNPEQRDAASHHGSNARLLAGPGTGKTHVLSRRTAFLIATGQASADQILALTFTRAASRELRDRISEQLAPSPPPRVSTLHSFALRQLLRNSSAFDDWPRPLRIADDWEQRRIVFEDLKRTLAAKRIEDVQELFNRLEADWESLEADAPGWKPDPKFLSVWREHARSHGYLLRAQLVYELKRALEQSPSFSLEQGFRFLLVDEYQDLNRCDLAVVRAMAVRGMEIYASGDDDQSIYSFRKAHPDGIRRFVSEYAPAQDLRLVECRRCGGEILEIAEFVANQDPARVAKSLRVPTHAPSSRVRLTVHQDQEAESQYVAIVCRELTASGVKPGSILILLRTDHHGVFSMVLRQALQDAGLPVSVRAKPLGVLDEQCGRSILALLRLVANQRDSLAWRTLLALRRNGVGPKSIDRMRERATALSLTLADVVEGAAHGDVQIEGLGDTFRREVEALTETAEALRTTFSAGGPGTNWVGSLVESAADALEVGNKADIQAVIECFATVQAATEAEDVASLLHGIASSAGLPEQELDQSAVNILTMHQAKGLTAEVVFIPVAEDESIPGRQITEPGLGDERRLLYVSMTRAVSRLEISYCERRYGRQAKTGRQRGSSKRSLTRFLKDAPLRPERP